MSIVRREKNFQLELSDRPGCRRPRFMVGVASSSPGIVPEFGTFAHASGDERRFLQREFEVEPHRRGLPGRILGDVAHQPEVLAASR